MTITIRKRKQSKDGKISLYLEYYHGIINGKYKRTYEYLNLYLIDPLKSAADKQHNKEIQQIAETIRAKREVEVAENCHNLRKKNDKDSNFIDFYESFAQTKTAVTKPNWNSAKKHLLEFAGDDLMFSQIDAHFAEKWLAYLRKKGLKSNSIVLYFRCFKSVISQALKKEVITKNPLLLVKSPPKEEAQRNYLTFEDVKKLMQTNCNNPLLKDAFLFSCLTGLRWSDVIKLKWSDISQDGEHWKITFRQKKTKNLQYHYISQNAMDFISKHSANTVIFQGISYSTWMLKCLQEWCKSAGIGKKISFHCSRHTYAVLQLTYGTDIYTLQKMLGHASIATTQIYAKVIDEKRMQAANVIPTLGG